MTMKNRVSLGELKKIVRHLVENELNDEAVEMRETLANLREKYVQLQDMMEKEYDPLRQEELAERMEMIERRINRLVKALGTTGDRDLDESDEDHEGDPRWDDHTDPTGKEWHTGLEKRR